jgi:uncharacterized protein YcnI
MRPRHVMSFIAVLAIVLATGLAPASAHVTVQPPTATGGSYAKLTFRVPNERPTAGTTSLRVQMPEAHPLASVSVKPLPGWDVEVVTRVLDQPATVHGREVREVVSEIRWTGGPIEPGQFQEFEVSAGPLPDDVAELAFPAIQTYANGEEVAWIQPLVAGQPEPERPAPTLGLVAGDDGHGGGTSADTEAAGADTSGEAAADVTSSVSDGESSDGLGIAALVVAALALVVAVVALVRPRRTRRP